jgi:hypothetical protein
MLFFNQPKQKPPGGAKVWRLVNPLGNLKKNHKEDASMQPNMMDKTTAVIGADASEHEENKELAISLVLQANEEQMKQILEILFS